MRVLIVEDDPLVRAILETQLRSLGLETALAADGQQAIAKVDAGWPDLCLIDWMMPQMDGLSLVRHLRAQAASRAMHVIMLTARAGTAELVAAFDAGVDDFVTKPVQPAELSARIHAASRMIGLRQELAGQVQQVQQLNAALQEANEQLEELAATDALTGLPNRRHALAALGRVWSSWSREGRPMCVAMIDVDHFKQINDRHGHDVGDAVLRHLAGLMEAERRGADVLGRYGGEEFILGFPGQSLDGAGVALERLCERVRQTPAQVQGQSVPLSISVGVAEAMPSLPNLMAVIREADQMLYGAKQAGRDRVQRSRRWPILAEDQVA